MSYVSALCEQALGKKGGEYVSPHPRDEAPVDLPREHKVEEKIAQAEDG